MMPIWLLTAWPWIKKLGPWVMGVALILFAILHFEGVGQRRAQAVCAAQHANDVAAMNRGIDAIHQLQTALDQKNAESLARAKALQDEKDAAAKADAANDRAWEATQQRLSVLARVMPGGCVAPDALIKAVEGL